MGQGQSTEQANPLASSEGRKSSEIATKNHPFRIYIGYDSHEDITFEVAKFSILKYASVPVEIIPLKRPELQARGVYTRSQDPKQSTEFTYCRFFVPYLNNYKGWALFVYDDFLWTRDVAELLDMIDDKYALMCLKHDYKPSVTTKLAGRQQEAYPRKNWSSMVLWNCGHEANKPVELDLINREGGAFLHRFTWITDDELIGEIPFEWNFLVEWYTPFEKDKPLPAAIHYTEGGPWFPDYRDTDYATEWFEHMKECEKTLPKQRLLCPFELFSTKGTAPLEGYPNSAERWEWDGC
ncbi:hypothetical protein CYMTET_32606 [Cymbomonas tetramitiformis]|uniref:Glycosyltransferase n=1 Tax=Cymbomonas tetramitiformis TaxID=36881 RepID=A0AAE0KRP6_9CHLO|nr:hypothetical protein CYMTET_32606 [Cymbomonas tetramitiformis]